MHFQIHLLQLFEDDSRNLSKKVFNYPQGEIWQLCANKSESEVICARYTSLESGSLKEGVNVFRLSDSGGGSDSSDTSLSESLFNFESKDLHHVSWMPGEASKLMLLAENQLIFLDMESANAASGEANVGKLQGKGFNELTFGAWNPHQNSQQFATVNEHHVRGWDVKSMKQVWALESPGNQVIRCIDFNPNRQYHLVSSGDDAALRFWDIRNPKKAIAVRHDHSHWVWSVKYNQFHDQLILSSSSDGNVVLSSMTSISSEPLGHLDDDDDEDVNEDDDEEDKEVTVLEDGKIRTYENEDSVYCAEWSATDPWIFASLSYDGRLVIHHVPRSIKFRILNLV